MILSEKCPKMSLIEIDFTFFKTINSKNSPFKNQKPKNWLAFTPQNEPSHFKKPKSTPNHHMLAQAMISDFRYIDS